MASVLSHRRLPRLRTHENGYGAGMNRLAVVDIDGTLVDTNYHHAIAWVRAFREVKVVVPAVKAHRAIGMGGDRLVAAVAGDRVEAEHGDEVREAWGAYFDEMIDEIEPLDGAHDFLVALGEAGYTVVLASSGKPQHIDRYLDVLGARDLVHGWTTAEDVSDTKPAPDLLTVAMDKAPEPRAEAVTVGDSVWDCQAAKKIHVPTVGVLTGGFGAAELTDAGAAVVYENLPRLCEHLDDLPTAAPR
jgi:phosphoglycolate phosphatase-like HAD superfamily hydrolase